MKPFALKTCVTLVLLAAVGPVPAHADPGTGAVEMTCTGAALATLRPALNAEAKDFGIKVEDTVLGCDDNRTDPDTLIIGARARGTGNSKGSGSCGKFTATIEVQVDWITTSGANPPQSKAKA